MAKPFTAALVPVPHGGHYVVVPPGVAEGAELRHGQRVRGTVNGVRYRSSLMMYSGVFHLGVHKATLAEAEVTPPAKVRVSIEADTEPLPTDAVPPELANALRGPAAAAWQRLRPSSKRGHVKSLLEAKRPETRLRRLDNILAALAAALLVAHAAAAQPREFREYPGFEGEDSAAPLPDDYLVPGELVIGRLMYPSARGGFLGGGDWRQGGTGWTDDYPRGDRTLVQMLRRFTRTHVRAVEQPVNIDDAKDMDYWPFMIVGLAGSWQLTDAQAANLREYLLRGGFMFCDSFFGSRNWVVFEESLKRVFPDRPIIDLTDDHPIFHTVFDLPGMTKVMIPHISMAFNRGRGGLGYGEAPRWRGVVDDKGRLMMLIAFNNDNGDAWQWADDPRYPGELANLSLRLAVNVAMYSMTH